MRDVPSPILCRPAGRSDTSAALALVKGIWGGDDYVPEVWDAWLADSHGLLAVAEWRGRLAGLGHVADLGWGEAWLEGLRVAPDLQGHGIGSSLHNYLVARWLDMDSSVIRLLTHVSREPVKAMSAHTGFHAVAQLRFHVGPTQRGTHAFAEASLDEPQLVESLKGEGTPQLSGGLMDLGWELAAMKLDRLEHTPGIRVWSWRGGEGWLVTRRDPTNPDPEMTLCALAGEPVSDLLTEARSLGVELGIEQIHWLAPESELILAALERAGFGAGESSEPFLVYERRR
jgi:GNAT superfamily N-acetyltransferase